MMKAAANHIIANYKTLADIQHKTPSGRETVAQFVEAVGYAAAVETIAAAIRCKAWDGRISSKNSDWADEATTEGGRDVILYGIDDIHPAHLDQIADAMRKTPEPEPAAEAEQTENAEDVEQANADGIGATFRLNESKNGVELEFTAKPNADTLATLKEAGFRWCKAGGYWYAKQTPERLALAESITRGNAAASYADGVATGGGNIVVVHGVARAEAVARPFCDQDRIRIYYNGFKMDGDKALTVKIHYSIDRTTGAVCIYARDFDNLPRDLFEVHNDSDIYTDYFDNDSAVVEPSHPLYKYIIYAARKADALQAKKSAEHYRRYNAKRGRQFYTPADIAEAEERAAALATLTDPGQPTAADLAEIDRQRTEAENARREAEHAAELARCEEELRTRARSLRFIDAVVAEYPATKGEPTVAIEWSENAALDSISDEETNDKPVRLSITAANIIFDTLDKERGAGGGYWKTAFAIYAAEAEGGEKVYSGRYDIGDQDGGLIAHIRAYGEYKADENKKPCLFRPQTMTDEEWAKAVEDYRAEGRSVCEFADDLDRLNKAHGAEFLTTAPEGWRGQPTVAPLGFKWYIEVSGHQAGRVALVLREDYDATHYPHIFPSGFPSPKVIAVTAAAC